MPAAISLLTIPVLGFLFGLLTGIWEKGLAVALIIHVVWVMIWNYGDPFTFPAEHNELLPNWFWSSMLASITGAVMTWRFGFERLLDGERLTTLFWKKDEERVEMGELARVIGKLLAVLLILIGGHVIGELRVAGFPEPHPGWVCSVLVALGWVAFGFLFRNEERVFPPLPAGTRGIKKFTQNHIAIYAVFAAVGHFAYVTAYWIWDFIVDDTTWITNQWYFYSSLIIFGAILVIMVVLGFFLFDTKSGYTKLKSEKTKPSPAPAPAVPMVEPEETPAEETVERRYAGSTVGRYANPFAV